jgi:4-hydroxy-4-methyl-2-oxoglutarate aldolase
MSSDRVAPEYRIRLRIDRPDPASYAGYTEYPTACISDAFRKRQTLPPAIKPVWGLTKRVVGPAVTVKATPGDEILALKAIEIAQPGDVIIVAGADHELNCFWGGIMSTMAKVRGVAGLVAQGKIRDLAQVRETGFPVWATGVTPVAPNMDVPPGELNLPITIGDVTINPGDLVVADEDGVVIVPREQIAAVGEAVKVRFAKEDAWLEKIHETKQMILRDGVEACLAKRTVEYLD